MLTTEELDLVFRALNSHRLECCKAIDSIKNTIGKEDPNYGNYTREYYQDINLAADLIDKIKRSRAA